MREIDSETLARVKEIGDFDKAADISQEPLKIIEINDPTTGKTTEIELEPSRIASLANSCRLAMCRNKMTSFLTDYLDSPFYWMWDIQSACTNGLAIAFSPLFAQMLFWQGQDEYDEKMDNNKDKQEEWYNSYDVKKYMQNNDLAKTTVYESRYFQFVVMHEVYHQVYLHVKREAIKLGNDKNDPTLHSLANIAQDCEINRDIEATYPALFGGCTASFGGVWFKDMPKEDGTFFDHETWEEIYDYIINNPGFKNALLTKWGGNSNYSAKGNKAKSNTVENPGNTIGERTVYYGNKVNKSSDLKDAKNAENYDALAKNNAEHIIESISNKLKRARRIVNNDSSNIAQQKYDQLSQIFDIAKTILDNVNKYADNALEEFANSNYSLGGSITVNAGKELIKLEEIQKQLEKEEQQQSYQAPVSQEGQSDQQGEQGQQGQSNQQDQQNQQSQQGQSDQQGEQGQQSGSQSAQQAADKAQQSADQAQQAADQAQQAADKAQQAADQAQNNLADSMANGDASQQQAAQQAADKAQQAADQAQQAADKAQQAADQAQQAADQAQSSASASKDAADKGNTDQEQQFAQDAQDAANKAQQAADQAQSSANQADSNNGEAQKQANGQSGQQGSSKGQSQQGNDKITINGEPGKFNPNDMVSTDEFNKKLQENGQRLDKNAGKDAGNEAIRKFNANRDIFKNLGKHQNQRGYGNSIADVVEAIDKIVFAKSTINWKSVLKKLFNFSAKYDENMTMSKRRMASGEDHPWYDSRYIKPKVNYTEVNDGLMQVFFLVDSSGSMFSNVAYKNGENIGMFDYIMGEIITLEKSCQVKRSGLAYFCTGKIEKDAIHRWTLKETRNKAALLHKIRFRSGDALKGGTDITPVFESLLELGKKEISLDPPTLILVVSDGGDDYSKIGDMLKKGKFRKLLKSLVFLLVCDESVYEHQKKVIGTYIPEKRVLWANINALD